MHSACSVIEGLESRTLFSGTLSGLIGSLLNSTNPAVQAGVKKVEADLVVVNANTQGLQKAVAPYAAQVASITKADRAAIAADLSSIYADRHNAKAVAADKKAQDRQQSAAQRPEAPGGQDQGCGLAFQQDDQGG